MCIVPLLLGGIYQIITDLAHSLNIIMHSKMHLVCLAAGLCSDPLGGELTDLRDPALRDREWVLKKVGQNGKDEKE